MCNIIINQAGLQAAISDAKSNPEHSSNLNSLPKTYLKIMSNINLPKAIDKKLFKDKTNAVGHKNYFPNLS